MNGVHDMGGMHGFGPVDLGEHGQAVFHAEWELRLMAIDRLVLEQGYFTLDAHRHGIERMAPAEYLRASYYGRWLAAFETILDDQSLVSGDELDARIELLRRDSNAAPVDAIAAPPPPAESPSSLPPPAPRFVVGDAVVTRNFHPLGHTRLPRYARAKRGTVILLHGSHTLPDANAHGLGEQPQPLYSVRFEACELWGNAAELRQTVTLDLWDSYLNPAPQVKGNGALATHE